MTYGQAKPLYVPTLFQVTELARTINARLAKGNHHCTDCTVWKRVKPRPVTTPTGKRQWVLDEVWEYEGLPELGTLRKGVITEGHYILSKKRPW